MAAGVTPAPLVVDPLRASTGLSDLPAAGPYDGSSVLPPASPHEVVLGPPLGVAGELMPDVAEEMEGWSPPTSDDPWGPCYFYRGSGTAEPSSWIVGSGDRLGIFSLTSGDDSGWPEGKCYRIPLGIGIHWLSGPRQVDLPARVYDFKIGF